MKLKANEITVSYKEQQSTDLIKVTGSKSAAAILYEHWDPQTIGLNESFKIMLLNNANRVKGIYTLSTGSITATVVDVRILFALVLKTLSVGIILAHNHPSSKLKPSVCDIELTSKIVNAAQLFDVSVLDHIILTPGGDYFSFSDQAMI
ncbi:JAB domain-containing protein [Zhouia spongiae]|uniref:JAB domain-containing protein n=1 Tax=Zhouia spongiae TaxID=2202721 RepID=A0ABY3YL34_9FLAO|nr:JAB domain-containing protein [Zhouia spongiae]UNY98320.1 JAB domain-containing protein [Zhouia spongiae]